MNKCWYIYILECNDGSFYTGIATNLERRVTEHNSSATVSAKYTRYRRPVKLIYKEVARSRSVALTREREIKKLSRANKQILIASGRIAQR